MSDFIDSPMTPIASPPSGNKGTGGGTYDGLDGYPKRTSSPNACPEKTIDGNVPTAQNKALIESPLDTVAKP